jgi:hypothetical protein
MMPKPTDAKKVLEMLYGAPKPAVSRLEYKDGGAVSMQDGGDPTQMFNFNPMATKAAKQKQMRESTPETPLGALSRGFASGLFGNIEDPVPYTGSIMEGSPQRQQSQASLREIGRNVGALTDIGGMVTPFVKPATQAITRGATALGRTGLEQVDRAMFGEGPLGNALSMVAPLNVNAPVSRLGFYNPIEETATTLQRKQGPGQAFLNEFTRAGISKQRLEDAGLAQKLAATPNVTREEVQAMTKGTMPDVEEVVLSRSVVPPYMKGFADLYMPGLNVNDYRQINQLRKLADERYQKALAENDLDAAEFAMKAEEDINKFSRTHSYGTKPGERLTEYHEYQEPGGKNYREVLLKVPSSEKYDDNFRSSHWSDPNVISHIRMNDRVDADNKNVLFIEELQSDWAQEGRKKGFAPKNFDQQIKEGIKRLEGLRDQLAAIKSKLDQPGLAPDERNILMEEYGTLTNKQAEEIDWGNNLIDAKNSGIPEGRFVKNTNEWVDLSLKNIIRRAVDEGYDRVAFIDGYKSYLRFPQGADGESTEAGMRKFYDEIIPGRLKALVGKDNVRTIPGITQQRPLDVSLQGDRYYVVDADTDIAIPDHPGFRSLERAEQYLDELYSKSKSMDQIGFDITPEIREKFSKPIPYKEGGAVKRVHISDNPDTMLLELAMGGPVRMAGGKAVSDVAEFAGKKFLPKAAAASADISKLGDTTLGQAVKEGRRQRESVTLSGALAPLQAPVRGETSKELLKAQTKQLTDQEKETLDGLRQTYPDFSNAVKFMTPQEVSKIIRNPEGVKEMDRLLQTIPSAKELAAVAKAGTPKQGWYRASTQALIDVFGVQDAPRFASLLAAMSPQTSVESNLINALNTWKNWTAAGRPTDPKQIKAIMGQSVQGSGTEASVLDAWTNNAMRALRAPNPLDVVLSGPKVDSFYRNLADDVYRVTNDAWMASGLGVDQGMFSGSPTALQLSRGDPGLSPGYIASSARMREAGQLNKMLPSEAQETTWSYFMPLYEMQRKTGLPAREILQRGLLTPESIRGTPDFSTLLTQGQYGDVLRQAGYGEQLSAMKPYQFPESAPSLSRSEQREVERAARRLEGLKGLRESESRSKIYSLPKLETLPTGEVREIPPQSAFASAQMEYIPGEGTGVLPDLLNASPGTKQYFSSRMSSAFRDPQERDILQRAVGLEPLQIRSMTGSFRPSGRVGFQGNIKEQAYDVPKAWETNPGYASMVEVPLVEGDIPQPLKDKLSAVEAARGFMSAQRGSTWNAQVPMRGGQDMMVRMEKKVDPESMRLASALTDEDVFLADTGQGVAVIHNPYKANNPPYDQLQKDKLVEILGGLPVGTTPTKNISDYIDFSEAITGPQGTGATTRMLQERLSPLDAATRESLSQAAQPIAGDVLEIMTKQHQRAKVPMREDYARALELIKRGGIPALMAALAAGEALPAEVVNDLLTEAP